jgi:uracil permease
LLTQIKFISLYSLGSLKRVNVKNKIDLNNTRNLVIASIILTLGIGGAELNIGSITIGGIGLAALVGVLLNIIIPEGKTQTKH